MPERAQLVSRLAHLFSEFMNSPCLPREEHDEMVNEMEQIEILLKGMVN